MPTKADKFPGSWLSQLDWSEVASGDVWLFTKEEMEENGAKAATVRVFAHEYARAEGIKFRTRYVKGEGLYIQVKGHPAQSRKVD